jgi:hypothetical protein
MSSANEIEKSRVAEIVKLHAEIGGYLRMTLDKAIRIGELLTEQKTGLKHGAWLPWIESNLPFSERTAQDYMRFYDRREELKSASVADLRAARKLLAPLPETEETGSFSEIMKLTQEYISSLPPNVDQRMRILAAENQASLLEGNKLFCGRTKRQMEIGQMLSALEFQEKLRKDLARVMAEIERVLEEPERTMEWQERSLEAGREMNRIMFSFGRLARLEYFPELAECRCFGDPPEKLTSAEVLRFTEEFGLTPAIGKLDPEEWERAIQETYNNNLAEYQENLKTIPKWLDAA